MALKQLDGYGKETSLPNLFYERAVQALMALMLCNPQCDINL